MGSAAIAALFEGIRLTHGGWGWSSAAAELGAWRTPVELLLGAIRGTFLVYLALEVGTRRLDVQPHGGALAR